MKKIIILLIVIINGFLILSNLSGDEMACQNLELSEKNYIAACKSLTTNQENKPDVVVKTFCRCIFRTFNVRIWADKHCEYDGYMKLIWEMIRDDMNVQQYCGFLRP